MTIKPILVMLAITAAGLALTACGGGSADQGSTPSSTAAGAATGPPAREEQATRQAKKAAEDGGADKRPGDQGKQAKSGQGARHPSGKDGQEAARVKVVRRKGPVAPLEVSGGGASQFKVRGGDNSVQEYGEEAGEAELRRAAETVHAFYVARVGGEWARACSLLAAHTAEGLDGLAANAPGSQGTGCPAALAALTKGITPALARKRTTVDAASLRHEGEQAFLLYTAPPGSTVYAMPLRPRDGAWRPAAINGVELPGT